METPYPFIRDSLSPRPGPPEETGAELFGPESSVALVPPDGIAARPASADTPGQSYAYEAVTLGVLAIFCYLLHSYRSSLAEAFKVVTMQLSIEKAFAEQTLFFRQFLTLSSLWGILLVSGLAVRYGDLYGLYTLLPLTADAAVAAVAAAVALIVGYRCLIVRIVGLVTRNEAFLAEHRFMNRIFSAFAYTLLTPLFLVVALVPAEEARGGLGNPVSDVSDKKLSFLCQKGCFNYAMDFVPLHRRIFPGKLFRAGRSERPLTASRQAADALGGATSAESRLPPHGRSGLTIRSVRN